MKNQAKKIISLVMAVLMCITCCAILASCGETNYAKDNTKIYIGASGPLSGGAAVYGQAVKNGAQMAVDEINAKGGINGILIEFVMMDDKHDPANVSSNYSTMYEAGMQVSLGCVTTGPCKEWKSLSAENNLFFMTPSASADTIVEFDNAYQMCFADNKQGAAAARYVNELYAGQSVGVLYKSDDVYSTGIFNEFKANLKGVTLVEASFSGDTVASFASQIQILKDQKFIFMPIYYTPASQFMTEAVGTVANDAVYYGCDGLDGIDTAVQGFDINTIPQKVSFLSHFNSKATEGAAATFIQKYIAAYGSDTLNQFGASAYDCVYAIAGAIKEAGNKLSVTSSPSEYCEALKTVFNGGYSFSGVTGTGVTWSSEGFVVKDALPYEVKGCTNPSQEKKDK